MEQKLEEEATKLRRRIASNRQEEERTRAMYEAFDKKEMAQLTAQMARHRREESDVYSSGLRGNRYHDFEKTNHREEDVGLQRRRENLKQADAHMKEQAAKHRQEEALAQRDMEMRRRRFAATEEKKVQSSFQRDLEIWKIRRTRRNDPEQMRRHQEAIKDEHHSKTTSYKKGAAAYQSTRPEKDRQVREEPVVEKREEDSPSLMDLDALMWGSFSRQVGASLWEFGTFWRWKE